VSGAGTGAEGAGSQDAGGGSGRRWVRWTLLTLATLAGLVVLAIGVWLAIVPDVEVDVLATVLDDPDLVVTTTDDAVQLEPAAGASDTTIVFYPGAGVPPDAYLATWAPVVEETAARVVIPTMPLRLAVLDLDAADDVREAAGGGDDGEWWIGGHSLGGAMAASYLADAPAGEWEGLVLWGAYPAGDDLADRDDLTVVSVSGTRDGLTTTDEVDDSRADLPQDATFAVLEGVNHAQFGSYGEQMGDLEATVGDDEARAAIAAATAAGISGG
jgi:hypothetical protein